MSQEKSLKAVGGISHTDTENLAEQYVGFVEVCDGKVLSGWCLKVVGNKIFPSHVMVITNNNKCQVLANGFRQDLHQKTGASFGNFSLDLPVGTSLIPTVLFENGTVVPVAPGVRQLVKSSIDNEHDAFFSGWAVSADKLVPVVQVFCDDELVVETYASRFREDLALAGLNNGYAAFRCRIPANVRGRHNVATKIIVDGTEIYSTTRTYSPLSVLIVSETERLEDASRYYRCENLRKLLQAEQLDASVIGPGEFSSKVWAHVDVIIFARFSADETMFDKVREYKENYGIKILYEIDDLVFLPWHTFDLGSVRSGVETADNPHLASMFARRLRLITLADGAITTTSKIEQHLDAMGIPCKLVPNMVRPHEITRRNPTSSEKLRILCMSGSPTHYRDFQDIEQVLIKFLRENSKSVEVTLLGHFRSGLQIMDLPNVKHIPRVPYPQMLQAIDKSDLCIVPLEDTEFNDAKSCLKFIECGARGVPVLASATADYRRVITDQINGLIAYDVDDWAHHLKSCASKKYDLHEMGLRAQVEVMQKFNIENAKFALRDFVNGI